MSGGTTEPERTQSFDPESEPSLSVRIVTAVADAKGVDVTTLEPLGDAIDIDRVHRAITTVQDNPEGTARISFVYENYLVTVTSKGTIELTESL